MDSLLLYDLLQGHSLFHNVKQEEFETLAHCLKFREKVFEKDQTIYLQGDFIDSLGIVLEGSVAIEYYDMQGNANILNIVSAGDIFGETYAALESVPLLVNVTALEKTRVLFINAKYIFTTCSVNCGFHHQLIQNLFSILAQKNINLSNKILHSTPKTIREKIENFLGTERVIHQSKTFFIRFNRQQMADYLNVERSALSGELSKMKKEGLIDYRKNYFEIKKMVS